jgi:hypothetical protein
MWLITATQAPCLIVSNTAVSGAPAVLTVYGLAPTTDAGTYKILTAPTPAGTVASHTHTGPSHTHGATGLTATDAGHTHGATGLTATDAGHTHTGPSHTHTQS